MDALTYNYALNTNKLISVNDALSNTASYPDDIDNQSPGNYEYDEIGNLKKDVQEGIPAEIDIKRYEYSFFKK